MTRLDKIKELLLSVFKSIEKESLAEKGDGWVNLAKYGPAIKKAGVDYRALGFEKLGELVVASDLFYIWDDKTKKVPVKYIKEKNKERTPLFTKRHAQNNKEVIKVNDRFNVLNDVSTLYALPEIGEYYKFLIEEAEFGWPYIVGFYEINKEGKYQFSDIRDTLFHEHKYPSNGSDDSREIIVALDGPINTLKLNTYYSFRWKIAKDSSKRGYKIELDGVINVRHINPQKLTNNLHELWDDRAHGVAMNSAMETISSELMASSDGTFIYELLQNANDYPTKDQYGNDVPVDVEFYMTDKYLVCRHTGSEFTPRDVASICSIGNGSKTKNKNAIGYKGIGFKTVFHAHDWVYIKTGKYSFRFDKSHEKEGRPFQIMPIWTNMSELKEIDDEMADFIIQGQNQFSVQTVMQPRKFDYLYGMDKSEDSEKSHEYILRNMFRDIRDIIFIPNIQSVKVVFPNEDPIVCAKGLSSNWIVSDPYVHKLDEETEINVIVSECEQHPERRIPPKYKTFTDTYVSFAAKINENLILPVENATVNCYLPTQAEFGFPFLMNTDMVPSGDRNQLKLDVKFNQLFAKIAGEKFFAWIKDLIKKEYDLDSIFKLIPDFDDCIKKHKYYKDFISQFKDAFEALIKKEPFVPVIDKDGNKSEKCINEVINDMTGLTANAVISDDDFISMMELDDYSLPVPELRQSKAFSDFVYKYSPSELDIKVEKVVEKCENDDFQKWLTDVDNNTRFIQHWIDKEELKRFAQKHIFIEYEGELFVAGDLYYDFDANCKGIEFLRRFIPHLYPALKNKFDDIAEWKSFADQEFQTYSASEMISNYIINNEDALKLLDNPTNSVSFYRYLSEKNVDLKNNSSKVPFITEAGASTNDYSHHKYFFNDESYYLTKQNWLGENTIDVLSHIYFDGLGEESKGKLKKFFKELGFCDFVKSDFITDVVVGDPDFCTNINATIENNFDANQSFVNYVFSCEVQLKDNSLKDYVLRCKDINGNDTYLNNDDVRYFNQEAYAQNSSYRENTGHLWLKDNMMYALSNAYFDSREKEDANKLVSFLRQQFGIKTFTDKSFFLDVVIKPKNRTVIYDSLSNEESMNAFLAYLKRDEEHIFDDTMSFNDIKDMPLLCYDGYIQKAREANVFLVEYNTDAIALLEKTWCPKNFIVLAEAYTEDFTQNTRQLFKITRFDINVVLDSILSSTAFLHLLDTIEQNIDFWRWIKANMKQITSFDRFTAIPLLDKENRFCSPQSLYISDTYQQDNIESLVIKYVPKAQFVSSSYIENETDSGKTEWVKLFKKLELKSDNKDILFSDILPNLTSFNDNTADAVVAMMTKHIKDLKDNWTEKRSQISKLLVRNRAGEYKSLNQVFIVNVEDSSIVEPFKYIALSNEVAPDILKANKELLLLISAEYGNHNLITTKAAWIEAKIREYISMFNADEKNITDIHVQFIREVAKIQNEYSIDESLRKQIKYRVKDSANLYKFSEELTLGSNYSPECDFEANGVTDLSYLSDVYIFEGNKDTIKHFFKSYSGYIHQKMTSDDMKYMSIRSFACYFWSHLFSRRISEYKEWIEKGLFKNIVCIPTDASVKKAEDLYGPHIAGYAVKANAPQWQEKVPSKTVVDKIENREARELFEKLNFRNKLSFEDCLYYLSRVNHSREEESYYRGIVLNWMLDAPDYDKNLVVSYRNTPTATWRNGKGQKKHISELYAIHPNATQERNIFLGNEFVMQTTSFPVGIDNFEKTCDILQIQYLRSNDFIATPNGKNDETAAIVATLRPRLLVLSAIENIDKFQELYEQYNEKLSQYHFVVCDKIDLGYDTIHTDVERIYNDENHIFYVNSWKHNRTFTKFCSKLKKLIGFHVYDNVCEDVLDESISVEACIEKYCSSLTYDEKFQAYLKSLDLTINVEIEEDETMPQEVDYYNEATEEIGSEIPKEEQTDKSLNTTSEQSQEVSRTNMHSHSVEHIQENQHNDNDKDNNDVCDNDKTHEERDIASCTNSTSTTNDKQQPTRRSTEGTNAISGSNNHELQSKVVETTKSEDSTHSKVQEDYDTEEYDTFVQVDEEEVEEETDFGETDEFDSAKSPSPSSHRNGELQKTNNEFDPDQNSYMGAVDNDKDYQPIGAKSRKPRTRKHPKNYTKEEIERLRSHGTPLELESLPATKEELDLLSQCNIKPEQIADTNFLAQLRLYLNLVNVQHEQPEETMEEFVRNADDVAVHKLKGGGNGNRYIHSCSAARGVMYVSPSVWNKMVDDKWKICVYLDGQGRNFHYIDNAEEFLKLVEKDDVVIKITGKEKVDVVKALYTGLLEDVKGTAYTLIRVAARTNMDAVFAHYVGSMAEPDDGNDDIDEYCD